MYNPWAQIIVLWWPGEVIGGQRWKTGASVMLSTIKVKTRIIYWRYGFTKLLFLARAEKCQDLGRCCNYENYQGREQVTEFHKMFFVHIRLSLVGPSWSQGPKLEKLEDTDMNIQSWLLERLWFSSRLVATECVDSFVISCLAMSIDIINLSLN